MYRNIMSFFLFSFLNTTTWTTKILLGCEKVYWELSYHKMFFYSVFSFNITTESCDFFFFLIIHWIEFFLYWLRKKKHILMIKKKTIQNDDICKFKLINFLVFLLYCIYKKLISLFICTFFFKLNSMYSSISLFNIKNLKCYIKYFGFEKNKGFSWNYIIIINLKK